MMNRHLPAFLTTLAIALAGAAAPSAQAQPYGYPGYPGYGPPPGYGAPGYPQPAYGSPEQGQTPPQAQAQAEGSVQIRAPGDGAEIPAGEPVVLDYKVDPGPQGDHVHVYVDGQEVAIVRELEGQYRVGALPPGQHEVAIKVVNRAHVPIGIESAVTLNVR